MVEFKLYHQLSTRSKRAIQRVRKKFGHPYFYHPRARLVKRLAEKNNMTESEVRDQLARERRALLGKNPT